MKNTAKKKKLTADEIAEKVMMGEYISRYFTNKGEMKPAVQRVNVDFSVNYQRRSYISDGDRRIKN